jgi:uncharacterized NAD-dependent epimerase/dehydratase family protein
MHVDVLKGQRRMILLVDGYRDWHTAKTAICLLRYCPEEVVGVLDREMAGRTCQEVLGIGGDIPVVGTVGEVPQANMLTIGIAPPGGKIPGRWRPIILEAIERGLNILSGLHDFLNEDPEIAEAARRRGVKLIDVRMNNERDVAQRQGIREGCLRIHTVANDCSCGKMVTAVEVTLGLRRRGIDAKFVATGQTGIMIEGDGCPVDRVICDFLNGAAEKLVLRNQHHEVLVIEGQGSLFHPRYSAVTLGLLHGSMPDGLIVCYEMGRTHIAGMPQFPLPPLKKVIEYYEASANIMHPCRVIGIAVNGYKYPATEVAAECARVEAELGLPACDVIRHGPDKLVDAVLALKRELGK